MTKSSGTIVDGESRPEGRGTGTVPGNQLDKPIRRTAIVATGPDPRVG